MSDVQLTVDEKEFVARLAHCAGIAKDVFGGEPAPKLVLALSDLLGVADDEDSQAELDAEVEDLKRAVAIAHAAFGDKADPEIALEIFVRVYAGEGDEDMDDDTHHLDVR